jgi:hypothetical protein
MVIASRSQGKPMAKGDIRVVPADDGWRVLRDGQDRAIARTKTQAEAAKRGREVARKDGVEFMLTGRDGRIRDKASYGNDPRRSKG